MVLGETNSSTSYWFISYSLATVYIPKTGLVKKYWTLQSGGTITYKKNSSFISYISNGLKPSKSRWRNMGTVCISPDLWGLQTNLTSYQPSHIQHVSSFFWFLNCEPLSTLSTPLIFLNRWFYLISSISG